MPNLTLQVSNVDKSIVRRIIHGFGANVYGQLVVVIVQIVGVPILLHAWGTQLYGEWIILSAIPVYLSMVDLGFSQSAGNDMTARIGRGDTQGANAVFQSLSALVYGFVFIGLILVALLVAVLPLGDWLHFASLSSTQVRWILGLLAAEVLVKIGDGVNHAGFRANGDYALHVAINANATLIQQGGLWALALMGHGPLAAAAWFAGVRPVVTLASAVLLFRRHQKLRPGFAQARLGCLKRLLQPALANLAMPLAQALNIQGMVLVVGAVMGPTVVVTFSVLRTLTRLLVQAIATVTHALEPEVALAWGQGSLALVKTLYMRGMGVNLLLVSGAATMLFFGGGWILALWTQGKVIMHPELFHWLLLSACTTVLWHTGINFLKALNRHVRAAIWFMFASGAAVLLADVLMRWTHHLAGAGMALFVADVVLGIYALLQMSRLFTMAPGYSS